MLRIIAKIALFGAYVIFLVALMDWLKDFLINYIDMSFMTPSMCWFFTKLKLFELLSTFISVMSAVFLKKSLFNYWASA